MASTPTMTDIAREAGVGVATVDRVINQRAPVKAATRQRVLAAARTLGFISDKISLSADSPPSCRTAYILLDSGAVFYREFSEQLLLHTARCDRLANDPELIYLNVNATETIAATLIALSDRVDVIGLVAIDHPLVNQAIGVAREKGVRVYSLFSELTASGCAGYIGLDNRKAGRTAAWALSRLCQQPGKIGILLGDHRFLCQETSEISFRSYFREKTSGFTILEPLRCHEDDRLAEQATRDLLANHPDLVALYVPSGGVEGVVNALLAEKQRTNRLLTVVCHGPIASAQRALLEGVVEVFIWHRMATLAAGITGAIAEDFDSQARGNQQRYLPFELMTLENF